tara:strand:- start:941 stop:1525 length:585 start_codon:yes stop_codon:yes gene_type:complete
MFGGIIKNIGVVKHVKKNKKSMILGIKSDISVNNKMIGSSISCDGVCLTLTSYKNKILNFYLSNETIDRSNFSKVKKGKIINLEKSLKYGDEIAGHFTQGHIDTVGKVKGIKVIDKTWVIKLLIPSKYNKFIVEKASIHINGVSLTISKKNKNSFEINIIPHTLNITNLKYLKKNNLVNIEFDIFGKYIYEVSN